MTPEEALPPLPDMSYLGDDASYGYDKFDMRDYAIQAADAREAKVRAALRSHLQAREDRIAELERDAARYRWLRKSVANPAYAAMSTEFGVCMVHSVALDAVVDRAIAATKPGKQG